MERIKRLAQTCIVCLLSVTPLCAQDIEKEFEEFERKQQTVFEEFRNKADAEFEIFLRETWKRYETLTPVPAPIRPEPPKPQEFDKDMPASNPVSVKPSGMKAPTQLDVPMQPSEPVFEPTATVSRKTIRFYGTDFKVATDAIEGFRLTGNKESDVADGWKNLCTQEYEPLLTDCMILKRERHLNDWAYLLFTKQIGIQLYGTGRTDDVVFLQMFLLCKSGYKVRLAKIDDRLKLMVASLNTIYGAPYLTMEGDKYYVFESSPTESTSLYTYRQNFADAKKLVCLHLNTLPDFSIEPHEREFSPSDNSFKVRTLVNKNLIDFYHDYPQCDVVIHYKTPMSDKLHTMLHSQLQRVIEGKSQQEAANLLLYFAQTAFRYQTDGEQFGYEKPYFPDETFYYPYCDCEDRAMLYASLVRELLGLDVILLDYPNHIASAVRFIGPISGDRIELEDGTEYLICDPTYIGAPIGTCMEQYKNITPEVIF